MDMSLTDNVDDYDNTYSVNTSHTESIPVSDNEEHMEVEQLKDDEKLSVLVPDDAILNNGPDSAPATSPLSPILVPSLKGTMTFNNGAVLCKGNWAMSDAAHGQLGQTSEFEFKLVKADEGSVQYPFNGKYQGWFFLKQPAPLKGMKIDDKEMKLTFESQENGTDFTISGQGFNKFGSFNLRGTLTASGDVHVYREYYILGPQSTTNASQNKRKHSFGGSNTDQQSKLTKTPTAGGNFNISELDTVDTSPPQAPLVSPRESSGRVRKVSTLMREYEDAHVAKTPTSSSGASTPKVSNSNFAASSSGTKVAPPPLVRQESTSDRSQRLSAPLKKCSDLLRELAKHPQAVWFLEPVDYIKFNIPDYPAIIKQPMDFRTIRIALEGLKYESHESFAEHVRLVFRNAMTFNQLRDNPVHIAAREMSGRFEDRYRQMVAQLGVYSTEPVSIPTEVTRATSFGGVGAGRPSLGGGLGKNKSKSVSATKQPLAPGPRPVPVAYLGGGGDASSHQIMEMQRMMAAMQEEINQLRSAVRENEIVKRLNETKDAAHNPLTFEEKKKLIAQIHKLPPNKMEQVLEIIQAAIPKTEDGTEGDIEVPLDALDTFTLRKLQRFIEDNTTRKKPASLGANGSTTPSLQRQNSTGSARGGGGSGEPVVKKPRAKSVSKSASNTALLASSGDLNMFDSEDMLFSTDCFDELRGGGTDHKDESSLLGPTTGVDFGGHASTFDQAVSSAVSDSLGYEDDASSQFGRARAGSLDEDFEDLVADMKSPLRHGGNSNEVDYNNSNSDAWQTTLATLNSSQPDSFTDKEDDMQSGGAREQEQQDGLHF